MKPSDIQVIGVETSTYCNLKCRLCSRFKNVRLSNLKLEAIENLSLEYFPNARVSMYGSGEPTLNPQILEIVSLIDIPITLGTNGTTHNENWWYEFASKLPKRHIVSFALDATDQKTYEYYRIGGNYNKAINNMKAFIEGGGKAWWQFILFRHNEHQVKNAEVLAKEYACKKFMVVPSWVYNREYQSPMKYKVKSEEEAKRPSVACRISQGEIFISSDGNYMPCCLINDLTHILRITGCKLKNAYENTLLDVINSGYYDDMLKRIKRIEKCKTCLVECGKRYSMGTSNIEDNLG